VVRAADVSNHGSAAGVAARTTNTTTNTTDDTPNQALHPTGAEDKGAPAGERRC